MTAPAETREATLVDIVCGDALPQFGTEQREPGRWQITMGYQSHLALTGVGGRAVQLADGDYPTEQACQQAADEVTRLVAEQAVL